MKVNVEFSGGLDLIFKTKNIVVQTEKQEGFNIKDLVTELKSKIYERPEFFLTNTDEVRPGILVLVNDSDWEIYDKEDTILGNGDTVSFISTLHGG